MITNPLLEEIYNTQKRLVEESGYDMKKYSENVRKTVLEVEKKYGLKFKYSDIPGGELEQLDQQAKIA
ncbi:hypothetical protein PN36_25925 [Candidatus Thiomargarita nelsonii]|uniref:Uncharacterized protein n=1 Tax=Candidatus Thiomargarita nelsonii TaxID=1003181 RepID=A0A4E0R058_9GAMM|nr:hypothetical protein PN36_25925 [Candidatus Thiomargarita nelsonii]